MGLAPAPHGQIGSQSSLAGVRPASGTPVGATKIPTAETALQPTAGALSPRAVMLKGACGAAAATNAGKGRPLIGHAGNMGLN